ncbi:MAG: hypothetical protein DRJ69_01335, partial [Thermoprotei archaeon]
GKKVTVLARAGVDGACSAALLAKLLMHYGCPFEARTMSVSQLSLVNSLTGPGAVLDLPLPLKIKAEGGWLHVAHLPSLGVPSGLVEVNPGLEGVDGRIEACATALTYLMLVEAGLLDEACSMLLCVGVQGEGQVKPPPRAIEGLNESCLSSLMDKGVVEVSRSLSVFSSRVPISSAIAAVLDPPLRRALGNEEGAKQVLKEAGLEAIVDKPLSALSSEDRARLTQALLREALSSGLKAWMAERLMASSLRFKAEAGLFDCLELSRVVDGCAKLNKLALSVRAFLRPSTSLDWEGLEASFAYFIQAARHVRSLMERPTSRGDGLSFELAAEQEHAVLDAALALSLLHYPRLVEVRCRLGEVVKVVIATGAALERVDELLSKLAPFVERQGTVELGPRWIEAVLPGGMLNELERSLGGSGVEGEGQTDRGAGL